MRTPVNPIITKENSKDINRFGTYVIRSISTNKVYVGMTIKPFRVRWMRHLADLHSKVHHSPKLQEHFDFFGAKDLTFEIVKSWNCKDSETIKMAEQNEKDIWSEYSDVCFNSFEPRGGLTSKKYVCDESRETINELAKDPKISIKEAAKEIGVGYGTLQKFIKDEK